MKKTEINCELVKNSLVYFLKKELSRIGFSKAVLGLSGGLDSAVVAYLAAEALGPENVTALLLPYRSSSQSSVDHAMEVVNDLRLTHHRLDISSAVDGIEKSAMVDPEKMKNSRLGNIMARLRMIAIFDYSFAEKAMVLGTSNKSEIALGYSTLFGDIASAINPIGDIYKTDIFALARHIGVPDEIVNKPPSADLWEGQTDESEIGYSYETMDPVLYQLIDKRKAPENVIAMGFDESLVMFVHKRLMAMHYKRKIPIVAKLSSRTFGVDYLYAKDIGS